MAYVAYKDLKKPNEVLEKMAEYIKSKGYTVVEDVTADLDIYEMSKTDGEKFVFMDKTNTYFINLRSANGINIFGDTNSAYQDTLNVSAGTDKRYAGIGMIVSEGYSKTQRWYSQYKVPVKFKTTTALGTYMPVPSGAEGITPVENPVKVDEPAVVDKPVAPTLPAKPVEPTKPTDPSNNRINNMKIFDYSSVPGDGIATQGSPCFIYDNNIIHKYGDGYVAVYDFTYKAYDSDGAIPSGGTTFYKGDYTWPTLDSSWLETVSKSFMYGVTGIKRGSSWLKTSHSGASPFVVMTTAAWNYLLNYKAEVDAYNNKTSQAWADYNTALSQYNIDLTNYNAQVASLTGSYNTAMSGYNNYLKALDNHNVYLQELKAYNDYLALLDATEYKYTLFCNEVLSEDKTRSTISFSLLKQNSKYFQVSHLITGNINKYDVWDGGIFFTGSACIDNILESIKLYDDGDTSDSVIYPVFSSGTHSNTFLRIDIDDAPKDARGNIYWASSGTDIATGKPLSLPIRVAGGGNGEIPHYYFLQSHSRLDSGKNVNTLNCITLNLPVYMAVRVDPDVLNNYAAVGSVIGVYFISTLNVQTGSIYEINYPKSNDTCQAFSVGKRRGTYGFDGISIKQTDGE